MLLVLISRMIRPADSFRVYIWQTVSVHSILIFYDLHGNNNKFGEELGEIRLHQLRVGVGWGGGRTRGSEVHPCPGLSFPIGDKIQQNNSPPAVWTGNLIVTGPRPELALHGPGWAGYSHSSIVAYEPANVKDHEQAYKERHQHVEIVKAV